MSFGSLCTVHGCNKTQQIPRERSAFYRFPKVKDITRKWLVAANRDDLIDLLESQDDDYFYRRRYLVCSDHFEPKCFRNKNLLSKGLIKNAVPTKNLIYERSINKNCTENMGMDEIKIKVELQICQGCLSTDRRTSPMGHLSEMFTTLVGSTLMKDTNVLLCWECMATLRRLHRFQKQLKHAQDILTQTYQENYLNRSLTTLTTTKKICYDHDIMYLDNVYDEILDLKVDLDPKHALEGEINVELKDLNPIKEENLSDNLPIELENNRVDETVAEKDDNVDDADFDDQATDKQSEKDVKTHFDDSQSRNRVISKQFKLNIIAKQMKIKSMKNVKEEFKSYAKLVCQKIWKKPHSQYYTQVLLDEAEIEERFLKEDRKRRGFMMRFKCKECSLIYGRKIDLDRHKNLNHHELNTPHKCLHCKKTLLSLESLSEHWRTHSVFYKCNVCARILFKCSLSLHLSRSHVNVYSCTNCTLKFSSLLSFSEHYKKIHPFLCDYCNKKCALKSVLEKHIKNHHTPITCVTCDRRFVSYQIYRAHCREIHPDIFNIDAAPELCYCVECDRQFPSVALYKKHITSKHTPKPPKVKKSPCPECGKAFNKNSDMLLHYNYAHVKITKFHCDLCDKYFLKTHGLRVHMESVHLKLPKPKNKICDLCGRGFHNNAVLNNHRRTHTGERPFKCGACPAAFAQKGAMKIHQRKQHAM